jgi:hypothetical protein
MVDASFSENEFFCTLGDVEQEIECNSKPEDGKRDVLRHVEITHREIDPVENQSRQPFPHQYAGKA